MQHQDATRTGPLRAPLRRVLQQLGARNPESARRWAATALVVTITTCAVADVLSTGRLHASIALSVAVILLVAALLVLLPLHRASPLIVVAPLVGTAAVLWLDLLTADAGVTGQVFFCVPVIWAASQLRLGGAALVTAAAVAAEAVVALTLLPRQEALVDVGYLAMLMLLVGGVVARSAQAHERLVVELRHLASIDPLTGLVTRRALDAATALSIDLPGASTALLLVDLDRFKTVNDTHGHLVGDRVLVHVAQILATRCRPVDVVARFGGDELAVLMPACSPEAALERGDAFVRAVRDAPLELPDGSLVRVSISVGLASVPADAHDARELFAGADEALYLAKRGGRDRLALRPTPST